MPSGYTILSQVVLDKRVSGLIVEELKKPFIPAFYGHYCFLSSLEYFDDHYRLNAGQRNLLVQCFFF